MIRYEKKRTLAVSRASVPQSPFWARTAILPYSWPRASPLSIDYLALSARGAASMDVEVSDHLVDQLTRESGISPPLLIDATGPAEEVYGRGAMVTDWAAHHGLATTLLCSSARTLTPAGEFRDVQIAAAAWPASLVRNERLMRSMSDSGLRWGLVIPIVYPVTTDLMLLRSLADLASRSGASFLGALPIDLEPTAKRALVDFLGLDDEDDAYTTLFHSELDTIVIATERHLAALAAERNLLDYVPPPASHQRNNWNAAVHLTLASTRMLRMKERTEYAWTLLRAAQAVASLQKPIERIASVASLSIIPGLGPDVSEALEEWTRTGSSALAREIHERWRLRRDHGAA